MIGKAVCQPCCCSSLPCCEQLQRPISRNGLNSNYPADDYRRSNYQSGYNYKNKKQSNSTCKLNPETLEAFAAVRQRACVNYPELDLQTMTEPSYKPTTTLYPPQRGGADVRRQADLIDYTPESEFLKRMKQQCEYLRNNEENIFTALDELGFDECFPLDQSNTRFNEAFLEDYPVDPLPISKSDYRQPTGRAGREGILFSKTPVDSVDVAKKHRSAYNLDKKSEHVSRSKKPSHHRGRRKRASSEKSESGDRFEPTLKRPHEDSCERCWRYASPARSPVNKPDQKYDPNFRRAHSNPNFEIGDGYNQVPSRPQTPQLYTQSYTSKEGRRPITPTISERLKIETPSKSRTGVSQQQLTSQRPSRRSVAYTGSQARETRQPLGKENWQSQREKDMWRPETPASRQGYEIPNVGPVASAQRQQFAQKIGITVGAGTSRSQTKIQDLKSNVPPSKWPETKPSTQQTSSGMNYQNYFTGHQERPPRPKSCTPGIGYPQGYRSNVVEECIRQNCRNVFNNAPVPDFQTNNFQRQQARVNEPQSSFVAPGLFCYTDHSPRPCRCMCIPPALGQEIYSHPKCPVDGDLEDEFLPDGRPPSGRPHDGRSPSRRSPGGPSADGRSPGGRPPGGPPQDGRSPSGRSPSGRSPSGRSPSGRSPGKRSPSASPSNGPSPGGRSPSGRSPSGRSPSGRFPDQGPADEDFPSEDAPVEGAQGGRSPDGRSPGGRSPGGRTPGGRSPSGGPGARASPQGSPSQRQTKPGTPKGAPKTPPNAMRPDFIPHSDSTVYADLPPAKGPELSFHDMSSEKSGKKGKSRTPSPKGSSKGSPEKTPKGTPKESPKGSTKSKGKSPKRSPSSGGQKSGRKGSPRSSKSSKSPKTPKSSKSSKSPRSAKSSKSPKSQKLSGSEEETPKSKRKSTGSRSKSPSKSPKSPKPAASTNFPTSPPKPISSNIPTSQTSQGPPNEMVCTYDVSSRPQTVCVDMRELNCAAAYANNKIPPDQFKGTQVIRECCCPTPKRQPVYNDQGLLCCHCNLDKPYQTQNPEPYTAPGPSHAPPNGRPAVQPGNWRNVVTPQCVPRPRNPPPQAFKQGPGVLDDSDEYIDCPNRPKGVRLWQMSDQKRKVPYSSNMGPIVESQDYCQPPYGGYNVNPKTYFVFHMRKCNPGKGKDVEVLVEETAKVCPNQEDKRTKNMTEKMKKIAECPSDSMALRFQKGVSESCKTLQNSRILYF